ncbi:MAG: DUF2855 family protein [Actinomycetota bacterium]|jgi:hypothetical protein|nr:DUF2855 family protein [Actinomycetota bacterium]
MHFEVNRTDFRDTRVRDEEQHELSRGQVRMTIERLAVTTNNITYAVVGDMLDYWGFFPAEHPWGKIPAMGLASVVESANADITEGGRYFGFYPMASECVINAKVRGDGFSDVGDHRSNHAPIYTLFLETSRDQLFDETRPNEYLLFRGLFLTSFLADDLLADTDFRGATQTLVTSASSKTSIALAACLAKRDGHRSIGLTSTGNRAFVEGLDLYDDVMTYDDIEQLDTSIASGLVDMAGNATVRANIHDAYADSLKFSLTVGATHWEAPSTIVAELAGPKPEFFFAPGQMVKRTAEWGADELEKRIARAFHELLDHTGSWLDVRHRAGADAIAEAYTDLLEGRADPTTGYIVSL